MPNIPLSSTSRRIVALVLSTVRKHLGMDVAFVSRFRERDRILEHVDAAAPVPPIHTGQAILLSDGYCRQVVDGRLPELIPDTGRLPAAQAIAATDAIPIGAHLSVPIRLADGSLYGTFCCFSHGAMPWMTERDTRFMRAFADVIAGELDDDRARRRSQRAQASCVHGVLREGAPAMVYQPIANLATQRIEGFECLARFERFDASRWPACSGWTPDRWFREAHAAGVGLDLEIAAIQHGLDALTAVESTAYLSVNCSVGAILSGQLLPVFAAYPSDRIVVELTEHDSVSDYPALIASLAPLRASGLRIAIDDTGAGYASMRHVLQLSPDLIKLDLSLTRGLNGDANQRALVAALAAFARESGITVIAEGVESEAEVMALRSLGVDRVQGYLLSPPASLAQAAVPFAWRSVIERFAQPRQGASAAAATAGTADARATSASPNRRQRAPGDGEAGGEAV